MIGKATYLFTALILIACVAPMASGGDYFVDGYHGGIYGHYPLAWKTRFIVDKLNENPGWRIGLEIEPETWDSVRSRTPEAYADFRDMMVSGRMEYTNPTYAQPYCYNILGESMIRQFRYGIGKLREHFPGMTFTTYSAEEPCFTSSLPAILKGFGFKYVSLKCPDTCWGGYMAPYGGQFVNWIGPDGTVIPTVPRYACEELEANTVWQTTAWGNSKKYLDACRRAGIAQPIGMCYQDAGWRNGPWLGNRPDVKYVLWSDYFDKYYNDSFTDTYRFTQDDVRVNLMWGSQVMQRIGRQVRAAENAMIIAEKMGAICGMADNNISADNEVIDEAWRQLMLAQHHDSWIVPYNGLWHYGTWADAIAGWTSYARSAATGEIRRLAAYVDAGDRTMVKVFNTTLLPREEVVSVDIDSRMIPEGTTLSLADAGGHAIPVYMVDVENDKSTNRKVKRLFFKATVPPVGYATYSVSRISAQKTVVPAMPRGTVGETVVIENDGIRLELNLLKGGTVKSLQLKHAGAREFAPSDTCRFAMGELRGFFYDEGRFISSAESAASIVSYDSNPLRQSVTIAGHIDKHPFIQTYTLKAGSRRVDCSLHIDWQGNPGIGEYREKKWNSDRRGFCDDRYKLCLLLPTSFGADRLWKDAPFDVCESRQGSSFFNRWSEIKHNVILSWIDFTDKDEHMGLGLLTDHTGSYVHGSGCPTALTLQYSGPGLWGPDYTIEGPLDVNFALIPHVDSHGGAESIADESDCFNEPLQVVMCGGSGKASDRSVLGGETPGYKLSSAVLEQDGSVTMRLYNSHASGCDAQVKINVPIEAVTETDLLGVPTADPVVKTGRHDARMNVSLPVNGFRTYSIRPRH